MDFFAKISPQKKSNPRFERKDTINNQLENKSKSFGYLELLKKYTALKTQMDLFDEKLKQASEADLAEIKEIKNSLITILGIFTGISLTITGVLNLSTLVLNKNSGQSIFYLIGEDGILLVSAIILIVLLFHELRSVANSRKTQGLINWILYKRKKHKNSK